MALNLSRREALGVLGAIGAATATSAANPATAGLVEVAGTSNAQAFRAR